LLPPSRSPPGDPRWRAALLALPGAVPPLPPAAAAVGVVLGMAAPKPPGRGEYAAYSCCCCCCWREDTAAGAPAAGLTIPGVPGCGVPARRWVLVTLLSGSSGGWCFTGLFCFRRLAAGCMSAEERSPAPELWFPESLPGCWSELPSMWRFPAGASSCMGDAPCMAGSWPLSAPGTKDACCWGVVAGVTPVKRCSRSCSLSRASLLAS
jgi:hypothetical protein